MQRQMVRRRRLSFRGATHTDLYDQMDKIPFDRLVAFFNKYLGE